FPVCSTSGGGQAEQAASAIRCVGNGRWRIKAGAQTETLNSLQCPGAKLRCEIDQVILTEALPVKRGGTGWEGLGQRVPLSRHISTWNRTFLYWPDRLAGGTVKGIDKRLLGDRHHYLATIGQIDQHRCSRKIPVPDVMVNELVVPTAFTGAHIQRHQAAGEQVGTGSVATVVVAGGILYRQINQSQFGVAGHGCPDAGVAGVLIAAIEPG